MEIFIAYIILTLIIVITVIFFAGYDREFADKASSIGPLICLWPAMLVITIIISPFYGIYRLGKWFGDKNEN